MSLRCLGIAVVVVLALLSAGCGLYDDQPYALPTPTPAQNALQNAGFEDAAGWTPSDPAAFSVSGEQRHAGEESGELRGTSDGVDVSQQLAGANAIPEFVSGFYRVNEWNPAAGSDAAIGFRMTVHGTGGADYTLHFSMGGLQEAPAGTAGNVAYVFLSRSAPAIGGWTYFGYPVALAFRQRYGLTAAVESVEIALELRGDGTPAWFDDLYAGTQTGNPNRPPQQ